MKKNPLKISLIILILCLLLVTIIGCSKNRVDPPETINDPPNSQEEGDMVIDPEPEGQVVDIVLYFVNEEYVLTGSDKLKKILPIEREVTVGEKSLESIVLSELQKKPDDPNMSTVLENIKILSVDTAENIAYVNLSGEKLSGGSLQEDLVLHQIVYSLTELKDIEAVQILVDGSKRETLMGHFLIEEPLKRQELGY